MSHVKNLRRGRILMYTTPEDPPDERPGSKQILAFAPKDFDIIGGNAIVKNPHVRVFLAGEAVEAALYVRVP